MALPEPVTYQAYVTTIVSVVAIALSSITLGWTIYKDAIRKPKFRMSIAVKHIVRAGQPADGPHIFKRAVRGTHIHISSKHMWKYVAEFTYRRNYRHSHSAMLDRLVSACALPCLQDV
jgi:hypothetical protein